MRTSNANKASVSRLDNKAWTRQALGLDLPQLPSTLVLGLNRPKRIAGS